MKLIIAGSRTLKITPHFITTMMEQFNIVVPNDSELISGHCNGVDVAGEKWADYLKILGIKVILFLPDWETHGKAAGPIRNRQMAEYADILLLIWDGQSKGSLNMKQEMVKLKKPVYEVILKYEA